MYFLLKIKHALLNIKLQNRVINHVYGRKFNNVVGQ
jgi:hypothetical protein